MVTWTHDDDVVRDALASIAKDDAVLAALLSLRPGETVEYHLAAHGRSLALDRAMLADTSAEQRERADGIHARAIAAMRLHDAGIAWLVQRRNDDRSMSYLAVGRAR